MGRKQVTINYWFNTGNHSDNGYSLAHAKTEHEYYNGTRDACIAYAKSHNMQIVQIDN